MSDIYLNEVRGPYRVVVEFEYDPDSNPLGDDGHGKIRECRAGYYGRPPKRPGEVVLTQDRGYYRLYDFAGAMRMAKKDGWGYSGKGHETMTAGQKLVAAVEADMDYLRGYLQGDWRYVFVDVRIYDAADDEEDDPTPIYEDSCGGVETYKDYHEVFAGDQVTLGIEFLTRKRRGEPNGVWKQIQRPLA